MPGVFGIIGHHGQVVAEPRLRRMLAAMWHEPFYKSSCIADERLNVGAGWVAHAGSFSDGMPVWNEASDICLVLTGEIFPETPVLPFAASSRARLAALVQRYERDGTHFLEELNGWFSGVIIDRRNRKTVLFNDRYGLSRIYLHETADETTFASEAKALLASLPASRTFDADGLAEFVTCGCALQNRTLYKGISLLPAGSCWTFTADGKTSKTAYFPEDSRKARPPLGELEFIRELQETFGRILPKYVGGSLPVAMSLTGGLDGRMIMARIGSNGAALPCYTFGGTYRDCTDVTIARKVAKACNQEYQVISIDECFLKEFRRFAEDAVLISDGTMDVTGSVELFANKLARSIAPVRLTGNYGSEILRRNVAFKAQAPNPEVYDSDFLAMCGRAAQTYWDEAAQDPLSFIVSKQVPWHHCSRLSLEQSQLTLRSPYLDNELVALAFRAPSSLATSKLPALQVIADGNPALAKIPTDRGVVLNPLPIFGRLRNLYQEFTFKAEYAFDYGMPAWLARFNAMASGLKLERHFLGRHKFYHFRSWYRDHLAGYVKEVLLDSSSMGRPHLRKSNVERLLKMHSTGVANYTTEIHQMLSIELIYRKLLKG